MNFTSCTPPARPARWAYFVFSHDAWIKGSSQIVRILPLRLRQRIAFVAATRGHFAGVSLMLTGNHGANNLFYDVRTYDVNMPMSQIVDALNEFQPHMLSGYAAVLKALAAAQTQGQLRISPTMIGNGGEPLSSELKCHLERVFGVPVANAYASSEHLYMGLTLPGSRGMSLLEDDLIFELHDDHTCVTNLFNYTMPLIRYRMDDVLVPDFDGPAHYPFTRIREVIGRHEDALVFTNRHGLAGLHPSDRDRGIHCSRAALLANCVARPNVVHLPGAVRAGSKPLGKTGNPPPNPREDERHPRREGDGQRPL